jgi:hypothetical protein
MPLPKDWREFIALLNSENVEYVIVGAAALAFHGVPRFTGDLDVLVRPSPENGRRIERVLEAFGFRSLGLSAADFEIPDQVIQLGVRPYRIDLTTGISGVTFDEAWEGRVEGALDDVPARFIGREEFLRNKRATGRPKDLSDIEMLE